MPSKSRPLPFRKKKNGKEVGPFLVRIDGRDITLRTKDAGRALERAKEAKLGRRVFEADSLGGAAKAVIDAVAGTGSASTPPVVEPAAPAVTGLQSAAPQAPPTLPPSHTAPPALPPVAPSAGGERPAGASAGPTPVTPDKIIPPPADWADQVAAAAAAPSSEGAAAGEGAEDDFEELKLSESELDEVLDEAAGFVVKLQLDLQAELAARGYLVPKIKVRAAEVPAEYKGRAIGKKFWKRCFRKLIAKYFPDLDLPDWLVAPVLVFSLTVPVQLGKGASVIKPGAEGAPAEGAPGATP
jgi:hypothetical protein